MAGFAELAGLEDMLLHYRRQCNFRSDMLSLLCFELIFHPLESLLAPRVTIFAVQGSPGSAKETHEDPGLDFHRFSMDLETLLGTCFGAAGSLFRDLRETKFRIGFQVAF